MKNNTYPVMETFFSIQGEGFYQGHAAYFIRLAGCDVGCHWCDVKESWNSDLYPNLSADEIAEKAFLEAQPIPNQTIAVITGGEPLMHQLDALTTALKQKGFITNIETSGTRPLTGKFDWICLSPKKFKKPLPEVLEKANELKIIVYNKSDLIFAEKNAALVNKECKLYLQPEWSKEKEIVPMLIAYIQQNPQWAISLQIHKYLQVP